MVENIIPTDTILNLLGLVASAIIPILIIRKLQQSDSKKEREEKQTADDLKEGNEKIAIALKLTGEKIADDLRDKTEKSTNKILDEIEKINIKTAENVINIKLLFDGIESLRKRLEDITKEQSNIIDSLKRRADLTNGNIENIRNDLMDLQDAVDDIISNTHNDEQTKSIVLSRRKDRTRKRNQITNDARKQKMV